MIVNIYISFPHFLSIAFGSNFCKVSNSTFLYVHDSVHKTQVCMQLIPLPLGKLNLCKKKITQIATK